MPTQELTSLPMKTNVPPDLTPNISTVRPLLEPYLDPKVPIDWTNPALPLAPIHHRTPGLEANAAYFGHPEWAKNYFIYCHRSDRFRSRWQTACGNWDDKIVVDIGCGPGNVFATVGGKPRLLIGIDVSPGGLEMARAVGYTPIVGDAQKLPFISDFADLVVLNAALHHCDDMESVLREAARIVRPGGLVVTDHDPQFSAWNFRGIAKVLWNFRLTAYLWLKKGFHRSTEEQSMVLASEIHHEPGEGVTTDLFRRILCPLGFEVEIFPHNHNLGAEVLGGDIGRSERKFRIAQRLSGLNPNSPAAALSLLCRARKPL
jgi:SAM-dependent methyltransferase